MEVFSTNQCLVPVSEVTLSRIDREQDGICRFVTDNYIKLHPECQALIPEDKLRRVCRQDLGFHLEYIKSALATGNSGIFIDYLRWLRNVLENRNLSLDHPRDSLGLLRDYLHGIVEQADLESMEALLEAGIGVLRAKAPLPEVLILEPRFQLEGVEPYARAILGGDRREASGILHKALRNCVPYADATVGIVQPARYEIGRLWQANRITVAQEHLATAVSQNALAQTFVHARFAEPNGRTAMFASVEGNHHALGLRIVSDVFEVAGWAVDYLGADTPTAALLQQIDTKRPELLGLSVSLSPQVLTLRETIERLRAELGSQSPSIMVGGLPLNVPRGMRSRLGEDVWYPDAKAAIEDSQ